MNQQQDQIRAALKFVYSAKLSATFFFDCSLNPTKKLRIIMSFPQVNYHFQHDGYLVGVSIRKNRPTLFDKTNENYAECAAPLRGIGAACRYQFRRSACSALGVDRSSPFHCPDRVARLDDAVRFCRACRRSQSLLDNPVVLCRPTPSRSERFAHISRSRIAKGSGSDS